MLNKIKETTEFIRSVFSDQPEIGIILGSGLGNLGENIEHPEYLEYSHIPNFPVSTVKGHKGRLIYGTFGGKKVIALQGRFHFYEGYDMKEVTFPVRVLAALGIKLLIVSNAAGGMNPAFKIGDIMIIKDHINMFPTNPLIGKNEDTLGPRFPEMSEPYDLQLIQRMENIAKRNHINIQKGVYVGVSGPCFETPAEYRAFRIIGGDAVGMSTIPEIIVARHHGIPCFACSVITDLGGGDVAEKVSHEDVIAAANAAEPVLTLLISELISEL
jgi:purine-nucleoside phosphorylase